LKKPTRRHYGRTQAEQIADLPDAVLHFFEADVFAVEGLGEEVLAGVEPEGATVLTVSESETCRLAS
jgi:hypothetical protein